MHSSTSGLSIVSDQKNSKHKVIAVDVVFYPFDPNHLYNISRFPFVFRLTYREIHLLYYDMDNKSQLLSCKIFKNCNQMLKVFQVMNGNRMKKHLKVKLNVTKSSVIRDEISLVILF